MNYERKKGLALSLPKGFSLLELVLSITLFAILGGVTAIPFASRFLNRNNLENTTNEVISSLRTAQMGSMSGKEQSPWGVHIDSTKIIMFKGSSYAYPGTPFDQLYTIPPTLTVTPIDITFDALTGNASQVETIVIQDTLGQQYTVSVNEVGTVNVN